MPDTHDDITTAEALTRRFLGHIFAGDMTQAGAMVAADGELIPARSHNSDENPIFGRYIGPDGAEAMFARFGGLLEPGGFEIDGSMGEERQACLFGRLTHAARATGKPFVSDWALLTRWKEGKMQLCHFYEDTAALADAMQQ